MRKMTPVGGIAPVSNRTPGQASNTASRADCVSRRARWTPIHACGPWAKARCDRELGLARSKASGAGNVAGDVARMLARATAEQYRPESLPKEFGLSGQGYRLSDVQAQRK